MTTDYTTYYVAFFLSLMVSVGMTPLVASLAVHLGAVDQPGERRVHSVPIPRLGGLAVAVAFALPLVGLSFYVNDISRAFYANDARVWGVVFGSLVILGLGVYDDIKGARPWMKLAVQVGVAAFAYQCGMEVRVLTNPLSDQAIELHWLAFPVTLLWIVGLVNAMNLIDGIDGLAAGVAMFAGLTLAIVCFASNDRVAVVTMVSLIGALLGFLVFNSNPARIFLGDTGSMFLGFILATTSIVSSHKNTAAFTILVPAIALGVPILDTTLAMVRRFLTGKPIMRADRRHIHHLLLDLGLTQKQAVWTIYGLCVILMAISLATWRFQSHRLFILCILAFSVGFLFFSLRYIGYLQHIRDERRRMMVENILDGIGNRTVHVVELRHRLEMARNLDEMWKALVALGTRFSLERMAIVLRRGPGIRPDAPFVRELRHSAKRGGLQDVARLDLDLGKSPLVSGTLTVMWHPDNGSAHMAIYRLFFELVKLELDIALDEWAEREALGASSREGAEDVLPADASDPALLIRDS